MAKQKSALQLINTECLFTSRRVAEACKLDVSGFLRIERGDVLPKRETARELHKFYRGTVPLGVIYDPTHPESLAWFKKHQHTTVTTFGNVEAFRRPKLRQRRLDARRRR